MFLRQAGVRRARAPLDDQRHEGLLRPSARGECRDRRNYLFAGAPAWFRSSDAQLRGTRPRLRPRRGPKSTAGKAARLHLKQRFRIWRDQLLRGVQKDLKGLARSPALKDPCSFALSEGPVASRRLKLSNGPSATRINQAGSQIRVRRK